MASKDTFEGKTFASNTFAAGVFRGVGVTVVIDEIGLEFTAPPGLIHWTATRQLLHFTAPSGRIDWTAPEQDR